MCTRTRRKKRGTPTFLLLRESSSLRASACPEGRVRWVSWSLPAGAACLRENQPGFAAFSAPCFAFCACPRDGGQACVSRRRTLALTHTARLTGPAARGKTPAAPRRWCERTDAFRRASLRPPPTRRPSPTRRPPPTPPCPFAATRASRAARAQLSTRARAAPHKPHPLVGIITCLLLYMHEPGCICTNQGSYCAHLQCR